MDTPEKRNPSTGSGSKPKPVRKTGTVPKPASHPAPTSAEGLPTPPPSRPGKKIFLKLLVGMLAVLLLIGVPLWKIYKPGPIIAEKFLFALLLIDSPFIQEKSVRALQEYPTRHTAMALIAFINIKNLTPIPPPGETAEQKQHRLEKQTIDLALASDAVLSLCVITGQDFGTHFMPGDGAVKYSWSDVKEDDWGSVLYQIDGWAVKTFGEGKLGGLENLL